jgi:hypothetical protein
MGLPLKSFGGFIVSLFPFNVEAVQPTMLNRAYSMKVNPSWSLFRLALFQPSLPYRPSTLAPTLGSSTKPTTPSSPLPRQSIRSALTSTSPARLQVRPQFWVLLCSSSSRSSRPSFSSTSFSARIQSRLVIIGEVTSVSTANMASPVSSPLKPTRWSRQFASSR